MMFAFVCFFTFYQALFNQVFNRADSLYANGDYTDFIRFSKNELLQNPDLRNDYATVIKLAEASLQEEKYDLAEKVFDRAKELDSLLNDFIDYKKIQISLLKKDTVRYFDQVDRFIDRYPEFILNKNILKESIALGAHDRYYQRLLRYLSDSEKLELDVQQLKHMVMIRDSLRWDFIEKNKDHRYTAELIDSIIIDSNLNSKQKYLLFSAGIAHNKPRIYEQLINDYDQFKELDRDQLNYLQYLEAKNRYTEIIDLIKTNKPVSYYSKIYMSRLLPRTYIKIGQITNAYNSYLDFARKFPDHYFALSAVTYVLEKYALSNQKKFDEVIAEFSRQKSKYSDYYSFYSVLNDYERGLKKTAIKNIEKLLKTTSDDYARDRLFFWEAKIYFELDQEKEAYEKLKLLSRKPFDNYYTAKASISLIANKMDVDIPNADSLVSLIDQEDHTQHILGYHLTRVLLINDVFGADLARKEVMSLSWNDFETVEELQHVLAVYEKLGLYHMAFVARKKIQYQSRNPVKSIWERIKVAFPVYYDEQIEANAKTLGIESELVYAIMYRESLFQHDAVSQSDAHGLLQIIPETAENISSRINIDYKSVADLYDPNKNISIGTYYIKRLLNNFDNGYEFVLGAYNAGPGRVNRWKKTYPISNADLFVEKIGIEQTRTYIKKVMYHYYMYKILNGDVENAYYSGIKAR